MIPAETTKKSFTTLSIRKRKIQMLERISADRASQEKSQGKEVGTLKLVSKSSFQLLHHNKQGNN